MEFLLSPITFWTIFSILFVILLFYQNLKPLTNFICFFLIVSLTSSLLSPFQELIFNFSLLQFCLGIISYIIIGILISMVGWWYHCKKEYIKFLIFKEDFIKQYKRKYPTLFINEHIPEGLKEDFCKDAIYNERIPDFKKSIGSIFQWGFFWPWTFILLISDGPTKYCLTYIANLITTVFEKILDKVFFNIKQDLKPRS